MVAVDHDSSRYKNDDYAQYAIKSWQHWCDKHGIDFIVNREHDQRFGRPIWNKELIYEIGKGYDKIGIVDSDTMIHPQSPNIFELFSEDEFCGVNDLCDLGWLMSSIDLYQKFFPNVEMDIFKYINAGVLFFGKKHLPLFEQLLNLYFENKSELDAWNKGGGREQTLLNFILQEAEVPITLLSPAWNLLSIHKKNMFRNNWQLHPQFQHVQFNEPDSFPHFMKYGHVWHFTGFPVEAREYTMSVVWDLSKSVLQK